MNPGAANTDNFFNFKINHDVAVTGYPTRIWRATKKYSVNNALPIVAVNAWLQFSLAYVAAVIVTSHDMSFITNILNSRAMPAYALASVILGTILLTSLIIKHAHKQEMKDEILKNGKNTIDIKIRGGESDGINEIAQNASAIEIVPETSLGNKKENFSIVLPISGRQGEILENKRQENRNKIVLLTVPYVLSGLTVVGALIKFGFVNIQSWKQWTFIAAVGVIAIVGACITLSKLRNNEVDNACNTVKRFDNEDILLPFRKGSIVSVIENKFESKEENDPMSRLIGVFREVGGELCNIANKRLQGVENHFNSSVDKFLEETKKHIKALLDNLEEIIKQNLDGVEATADEAIIQCLVNIDKSVDELCKGVGKKVQNELDKVSIKDLVDNISRLAETLEDRVARTKPGRCTGLAGATFAEERLPNAPREKKSRDDQLSQQDQGIQTNNSEKPDAQRVDWAEGVKEIGQLKKKIEALKRALEEKESNQTQADSGVNSETSSTTSSGPQRDEEEELGGEFAELEKEEKRLDEEWAKVKLKERVREKQERIEKFKKGQEVKERKEKINGKPSEFLYYVLESIKLEEKGDKEKDSKVEATLRNFNNKIIIHWKDGSQTICHIKKQGNLPSTEVDFVDKNIQAAFETACVG